MICANEYFYEALPMDFISEHRPDVIFTYGGFAADRDRFRQIKDKGIPLVFYLTVGTHNSLFPFRDMDLIITDTAATADHYRKRLGLEAVTVGKFVEPVALPKNAPQDHATMIGALPAKGAALFLAIAQEAKAGNFPSNFLPFNRAEICHV
jgi:hypothetical protein